MSPQWQTAIVSQVIPAAPQVRRYVLRLPENDPFDFIPGQFVTLDLPIHEQRNKRWRSYSIASAPTGGNEIELVIVRVEGGVGSSYIFNEWREGSDVLLRGPHGVFVLPDNLLEKELILICTGTGIAPFRSMARYIQKNQTPHLPIHLIFGTRTRSDLLYYDELKQLEQELEGFRYHPVLSRESWNGRSGYVHQVYEELCQDRKPAQFMLCGWRNMIDEAKNRILALGYSKKDIHQELYG